jgi:hypothetical protein
MANQEAPTKRKKATADCVRARLDELLRIKLDGAQFWDVRDYVREKEQEDGSSWQLEPGAAPMSDGQIRRYLQRVDAIIAESVRGSRKKLIRRHLARRENLYAKAVLAGDIRTALAVLRDEAELVGLYPATKIAPTNLDGTESYASGLAQLTDEEIGQRVAQLRARNARLGIGDAPSPSPN